MVGQGIHSLPHAILRKRGAERKRQWQSGKRSPKSSELICPARSDMSTASDPGRLHPLIQVLSFLAQALGPGSHG